MAQTQDSNEEDEDESGDSTYDGAFLPSDRPRFDVVSDEKFEAKDKK